MESRRRIMLLSQNVWLNLVPFIAPADFNPNSQEFNIYNAYNEFINSNKKLIFSVGSASSTTVVAASTGRSYYYGQDIEGIMTYNSIASGTITWTATSTKRHVFVIDTNTTITYIFPASAIWGYIGNKVTSVGHNPNNTLKYIHTFNIYSLTTISSFNGCTNLSGLITLPEGILLSGTYQFYNCQNIIGALIIPNSVTSLSTGQFSSCKGLTSVTFGNAMTNIGPSCFEMCIELSGSLNFPNTLLTIGNSCFTQCTKLTGSLVIPPLVTAINAYTFQYCSGFTNLSIHANVATIGDLAFRYMTGLTRIDNYRATPQPITGDIFTGVAKNKPLHVPVGSKAAYQSNAYWNLFTNIIEDL